MYAVSGPCRPNQTIMSRPPKPSASGRRRSQFTERTEPKMLIALALDITAAAARVLGPHGYYVESSRARQAGGRKRIGGPVLGRQRVPLHSPTFDLGLGNISFPFPASPIQLSFFFGFFWRRPLLALLLFFFSCLLRRPGFLHLFRLFLPLSAALASPPSYTPQRVQLTASACLLY